jgi:hypothetical protein
LAGGGVVAGLGVGQGLVESGGVDIQRSCAFGRKLAYPAT